MQRYFFRLTTTLVLYEDTISDVGPAQRLKLTRNKVSATVGSEAWRPHIRKLISVGKEYGNRGMDTGKWCMVDDGGVLLEYDMVENEMVEK